MKETPKSQVELEQVLRDAYNARVNLVLVYDPTMEVDFQFGARCQPWGKNENRVMTYAPAPTPLAAATQAVHDAVAGNWLDLDYSFRGFTDTDNAQEPE